MCMVSNDGGLAENHNFNPDGNRISQERAIPIQPKAPLLLGNDPYGTDQPDFVPRDVNSRSGGGVVINLDQLEDEDKDASIILDRPQRVKILGE